VISAAKRPPSLVHRLRSSRRRARTGEAKGL
jgi:hypothetical protein